MKKQSHLAIAVLHIITGGLFCQEQKFKVKKSITVTSPKAKAIYRAQNTLKVAWKSAGITGKVKAIIFKSDRSERKNIKSNLPPTGSFSIEADKIPVGKYFIRIQEMSSDFKGDSGVFSVVPALGKPKPVKREPKTIEKTIPAQKRDRHSKRSQAHTGGEFVAGSRLPQEPTHPSMPGKARVGFENHYLKDGSNWFYKGYIFCVSGFFSISALLKGKKVSF